MKIKSIKSIPFEGTVYNLGVEDDESYIVNSIVVHNCRCLLTPVTKFEVQRLIKSGEGIELSTGDDFPEGFPDIGFNTYAEDIKALIVSFDKDMK